MPVEKQSDSQMAKTIAFRREPELQRKKKTAMGAEESFIMKPMEPAMQGKKRVEPGFIKTSPVKPVSEPVMQSKRRLESSLVKHNELSSNIMSVEMQSKRKAPAPVSALQCEPPLQSKRRTPGPPTTLTNGFYENGRNQDEYALLGNQDKFAENVKYKVKPSQQSRDISPPKQMKLQKKEKENKLPSPGPVVDTSQFSKPVTPLAPRKPKNQSQPPVKEQKESNVQQGQKKVVTRSPKQSESEPKRSERKPFESVEKLNLADLVSPTVKEQPKIVKEINIDMKLDKPTDTKVTKDKNVDNKPDKLADSNAVKQKTVDKAKVEPAGTRQADKGIEKLSPTKVDKEPAVARQTMQKAAPRQKVQEKQAVKAENTATVKNVQETKAQEDVKADDSRSAENKNLDMGDPVKDSMKAKKIGNMNEFVQTNMEKGITDSAAEAPADYALKYKTGIAPPRPTKKVSEYQKQFAWKAGLPASPLLKAEQVVYNSVPTLSPPKKDVIPKVSEYQKQFKQFPLVPVPKEDKSEPVQSKRKMLPRSKSMEGLSPAEIPTAGSKPVIAPNNKRLTLETDQKPAEPAPVVPRKKQRQFQSEYKSNYKSPTRFDYVRGSWHGADPPQVKIKADDTAADSYLANWFAEVIELRRKAGEYRKRAEGTHFSREHLVQLMAKQTDLWDASTLSARSNLSALSLESGLAAHKNRQEKQKQYRGGYSTAATIASEDDQKVDSMTDEDDVPPVKQQAWADQDNTDETPRDSEAMLTPTEGRLTTPKLRDQIKKDGKQKRRHHLDRTTPCVGGALLSSPPQQKSAGHKMADFSDNGSIVTMEEEEQDEEKPAYKPLAGQKTYTVDRGNITPAPTFGLMTRDTHTLRDDDASVDRPLPTQYVHTPLRGKRDRPGGLDTIGEGFGETYNKTKVGGKHDISWTIDGGLPVPRIDADDDVLSVSMQSIASSCSVASATLDRARKRKEEFWGKDGIASR